jgi:uncharacterized HAD superfamily protein
MKIGIDLDDVVTWWVPHFIKFYNNKTGSNLKFEDWKHYRFEKLIGMSKDEVRPLINEFVDSSFHDEIELVDGAKQALEKLSGPYEISFITARPLRYAERTRELLSRYHLKIPLINCRNKDDSFINKGEICSRLDVGLFIDDSREYALTIAEKGIQVFLFNRPWNQENSLPENITRIYSWNEALKELIK